MIPALVLSAGLATRLRPLSRVRAKAAVPVGGRPLVAHLLDQLHRAGISEAVLNLHHLPGSITGRVGDGSVFGVRVRYSWEGTLLGSAGGPKRAAPLMGSESFLILNGDTLAEVDLRALVARHLATQALVTLAVTPNTQPQKYRGVAADASGAVTGFVERGHQGPSWHFMGVQVVNARAFATVPPDVPWESVAALYPSLIAGQPGTVRVFEGTGAFHDIGTPADYLATSLRLSASRGGAVADSVLWDDVSIGPGASLTRCVVTDGVHIPAGTEWRDCTIRLADGEPLDPGETRVGDLAVGPVPPPAAAGAPAR